MTDIPVIAAVVASLTFAPAVDGPRFVTTAPVTTIKAEVWFGNNAPDKYAAIRLMIDDKQEGNILAIHAANGAVFKGQVMAIVAPGTHQARIEMRVDGGEGQITYPWWQFIDPAKP